MFELALRTNAVMATFDGKLAQAMHRAGGTIFWRRVGIRDPIPW